MPASWLSIAVLGWRPCSVTATIAVLYSFGEFSYEGMRGPLWAMTSWIVIGIFSAATMAIAFR